MAVAGHLALLSAPLVVIGEVTAGMASPGVVTLLVLVAVWHVLESGTARAVGAPAPVAMRENPGAAVTGIGVLITFWVCIADGAQRSGASGIGVGLGSLVMMGGVMLRIGAIRALGAHFSSDDGVSHGARLVTNGIYAVVRHPSELGTVGLVGGAAMLCASGWGAGVGGVVVRIILWRIRREDRQWRRREAVGFARYEARVGGLVPGLRIRHG